MNDADFIDLLIKNSLKMQNKEVDEMKKDMDGLRKTVEKSFNIDVPKTQQRSMLLMHPDDMKRKDKYHGDKYHDDKYYEDKYYDDKYYDSKYYTRKHHH